MTRNRVCRTKPPARACEDGVDRRASDDDGLSLPAFSSSSDDQPGWLAHAPTDEQLTAQFLADDDDSGKKKSKKHESKKSKRRAARSAPSSVLARARTFEP